MDRFPSKIRTTIRIMVYMSLYTCTALNCFDCASNLRWRDTPLSILSNTESYSMLTHTVLHVVCCHTPPVTPVTRDTPAIASRVARDRHTAPRDRPCMRIAHHPPTQPTMHRYKNTHTGMRSSRVRPWSAHGDRRSHASDIWDIVARRRCVFSPVSAAAVVSCLILARVDRRTRATTTTT